MINIKIKFLGIFRELCGEEIIIKVENKSDLSKIRSVISNYFLNKNVNFLNKTFERSMFSNEEYILSEDYLLKDQDVIYLLPPFSGG